MPTRAEKHPKIWRREQEELWAERMRVLTDPDMGTFTAYTGEVCRESDIFESKHNVGEIIDRYWRTDEA